MTRPVAAPTWKRGISLKSAAELTTMRRAGRVLAEALNAMRAALKPGVTTRKLDAIAARVIDRHGAAAAFKGYPGPYPYPAVATISVNDELVHGLPGPRVVREGDLVKLDCGVIVDGYYADSAISVGVGQCSPEVDRLVRLAETAFEAGLQQACAGRRIGDISAAIEACVTGQGYHLAEDYTGHGIGRAMHEDPEVPNVGRAGKGAQLRPGLTIAIEPMIIVGTTRTRTLADEWTVASADGSLTAHWEHTVAITDNGPEILTQA